MSNKQLRRLASWYPNPNSKRFTSSENEITNAPQYVSKDTLYHDIQIETVNALARKLTRRFEKRLHEHYPAGTPTAGGAMSEKT